MKEDIRPFWTRPFQAESWARKRHELHDHVTTTESVVWTSPSGGGSSCSGPGHTVSPGHRALQGTASSWSRSLHESQLLPSMPQRVSESLAQRRWGFSQLRLTKASAVQAFLEIWTPDMTLGQRVLSLPSRECSVVLCGPIHCSLFHGKECIRCT